MPSNASSAKEGVFSVFLTSIICGEIHLRMEELLALCDVGDQNVPISDGLLTDRLDLLDACLELLVSLVQALVDEQSPWPETLSAETLSRMQSALSAAAKDCTDFLSEASTVFDSLSGINNSNSNDKRSALVAAAERTAAALAVLVLEDDSALPLLLAALPRLLALGQVSPKLQLSILECLLQRLWSASSDNSADKQTVEQLQSLLDTDGQIVLASLENLSKLEDMSGVGSEQLNLVRVSCELLILALQRWKEQADRLRVPVNILLLSEKDGSIRESCISLKEKLKLLDIISIGQGEAKDSLETLLAALTIVG